MSFQVYPCLSIFVRRYLVASYLISDYMADPVTTDWLDEMHYKNHMHPIATGPPGRSADYVMIIG